MGVSGCHWCSVVMVGEVMAAVSNLALPCVEEVAVSLLLGLLEIPENQPVRQLVRGRWPPPMPWAYRKGLSDMGLCTGTHPHGRGLARLHSTMHADSTHVCICAHICAPFLLHKPWESWEAVQKVLCLLLLLAALGSNFALYDGLSAESPLQADEGECVFLWELTC